MLDLRGDPIELTAALVDIPQRIAGRGAHRRRGGSRTARAATLGLPVLAVDADPQSNLTATLAPSYQGAGLQRSLATVLERLKVRTNDLQSVSAGIENTWFADLTVPQCFRATIHTEGTHARYRRDDGLQLH